jgi:ribonuclease BN (tRNA processing enzyme)
VVRLTVLGSGDAFGSGGRLHSAYLVEADGLAVLIDCGPTILQSLKRLGRDARTIDHVLISHLHGDHFGGVPFLFMEYRYEQPRTRPLRIYGPSGVGRRVEGLFGALYEQTAREPQPHPVEYVELSAGRATDVGGASVVPVSVPHVPELMCFAYRIEIAGRSILYSGDTGWHEELARQAHGVDLFLCECSTYDTRLDIHVSYPEVAARAADLGCRRLVLTHLGREPLERLDEITIETARDGMTIEL